MPSPQFEQTVSDFDKVWVHWPSIVNILKDIYIGDSKAVQCILSLWENGSILELSGEAELPAIAELNNTPGYEDNVSVYCATFNEYVELRKTYGAEDITYFRRI